MIAAVVHYHHGWQLPDPVKKLEAIARMSEDACRLSEEERRCVEQTIAAHSHLRNWVLHAVNCRSNHVHAVITADVHPDTVRTQLKSWCTRRLKELYRQQTLTGSRPAAAIRTRWWAERGSGRYLNDGTSLEAAIRYVRDGQDAPRA